MTAILILTNNEKQEEVVKVEAPHPAEDGHQVVLTHREHVDVFDDDHLVVVLVKDGIVHHICQNKNIKTVTLI